MNMITFANGDAMPIVGLGTWKTAPGETYQTVREAIRIGYRHIDCAPLYGNEVEVGAAVRDAIAAGEVSRKDLWICSKLWSNAHEPRAVMPALVKTLTDLGLGYLDLYLVHWPIALRADVILPSKGSDVLGPAEAPMAATWAAMEETVKAGLVRHIGVSNFSAKKLGDVFATCSIKPEMNQVELHPFLQQTDLLAYCASRGVAVTSFASLGSSDRPAFLKVDDEPSLLDNPVINAIASARGCTAAQVLLAWHVARGVAAIPKSTKPARLRENFAAADIHLGSEDLKRIAELDRNFRFVNGGFWAMDGSPWTVHSIWA